MNKIATFEKFLDREKTLFDGGHNIRTPFNVVEEICTKIKLTNNSKILVLFNVEFVIELVYNQKVPVSNITFYTDHDNKSSLVKKIGVKNIIKDMNHAMKFDVWLLNPPYLQGKWRSFMKKALEESKSQVVQVSPEIVKTSSRYVEMVELIKKFGIQKIMNCHKDFPGVVTSSEIVAYYFDKNKKYNKVLFNNKKTIDEKIIEKIQSKIKLENGISNVIESKKSNRKSSKSGKIQTLLSVTNKGVDLKLRNANEVYVEENPENYFFVNWFFGINKENPIYESNTPIGVGENVFQIRKPNGISLKKFKEIYLSKTFRFALSYFRGTNRRIMGRHLKQLPIVPSDINDLYSYFNFTEQEIEHIEKKFSNN